MSPPPALLSETQVRLSAFAVLADSAGLHRAFELRAAHWPDATAVTCGSESISYAELNRRSNQLARAIGRVGASHGSLVGLLLDRSVDMVVAVVGILKAGAGYVPIDAGNPPERIAATLADSGASVVVTSAALAPSVPIAVKAIRLDADATTIDALSADPIGTPGDAGATAYVIYTSGSTGKPKGVVVTHANVLRLFDSSRHWFDFGPADVWTLFHSIAFDFSVWELWGALLYGGRLVVVPQVITRSPERFRELVARERVTVLNQTPSAFRMFAHAHESAADGRDLALRYVIFGGEALALDSLRGWIDRHGDDAPQLINMYGITETTVHVTYRRIRHADVTARLGSVIGVPIPDLTVYLLDEQQRPVPSGMPGEIYVGGAGVARGYLNRPELTAQRFLSDPFANAPDARMYRSGDSAKRLETGDLEYLGRLDNQVKVRGFRIELGEIEAALRESPDVVDATVVARDSGAETVLVAYYTCGCAPVTTGGLRARLASRLPEYMVPSRFIALDRIPLTVNGKVDQAALPAPDRARPSIGTPKVAPRTPVERWVAAHWAELLNLDEVGVDDPFFELGGTSLTAVRLLGRLSAETRTQLPALLLFRAPTIAAMATILETEHGDVLQHAVPALATASPVAARPNVAADRLTAQRDELRERRQRRRLG